jgi:VanZ family protein
MKPISLTCTAILTGALYCSFLTSSVYAQSAPTIASEPTPTVTNSDLSETAADAGWWTSQPKENKMLYTNIAAATLIGIWGLAEWDYGSEDWNNADEGWFENDSKYGGADKLGHFWATYAFSDALTGLYKHWGYDSRTANKYATISAWSVQTFMEIADGTSGSQGFSWEDMVMNTAGALTSVLMERYPELDRKIDFRIEYVFNVDVNAIFDDYSNHYYSMVLKLDGFDSIENTMLKYLEFHAGYYTRGYEDDSEDDERSLYAGISLNFSRMFKQNDWHKTGKTLEYIQIPYTVLKASHGLD